MIMESFQETSVVLMRASGTRETYTFRGSISLETMQDLVGGYIEVLVVSPPQSARAELFRGCGGGSWLGSKPCQMVVNEEARMNGLPVNAQATECAGQPIVGDALLFDGFGVE